MKVFKMDRSMVGPEMRAKNSGVKKKQLVRSEVLAGLTFLLPFLSRERSNMFDQFFDVMRYDFRTLSEQTSKVLTSSVMS